MPFRSSPRMRRQRRPFSSYSRPVQITTILVMVAVGVLCLVCGIIVFTSNGNSANTSPSFGAAASGATDTPIPTDTPVPTDTPLHCPYPAVNNNPWCYTFHNTGKLIYTPPADFCSYFPCIDSFGNSNGYVVECGDGQYSTAGGRSGACSRHGGVQRPLYAP